jgi:medium-chain acyl-[acyl-carrier-protein] hydrolase
VEPSTWLLRARGDGRARVRLFCIPYAGGGGSLYMSWGRELAPLVDVCAVQLPGRETRLQEPAYTSFAELVDAMGRALRPFLDDLPFALFGHSMGALLAFELARRLRAERAPAPVRLFVSGYRAPEIPSPHPPLAHLPDSDFVTEIRARYDGVPEEVLRQPELMALLLPCLRADMALVESFRWRDQPPLTCPISAYGGRDDTHASETQLALWRRHTRGPFTMRQFAGTHFFIRSARAQLLAAIAQDLVDVDQAPRETRLLHCP